MGAFWKEIDSIPTDVQFSVFSSEEVKKLSVVKIITRLTFDAIGRPLPGGLYDPVMGTYGRSMDPCGTCNSHSFCPGHVGHIELNTPVYNPFFIKTLFDILKISCLTCFKLQINARVQNILRLQLELADSGYITEAQNLEIYKSETAAFEDITDEISELVKAEELLKQHNKKIYNTKASCAVRSSVVAAALQKPTSKTCIHCKEALKKVKYSYKKLVMSVPAKEAETHKRQAMQNKVILADECKSYLHEIYKHYPEFMKLLFPILSYTSEKIPVDIFFMEVVPVVPPKCRPTNVLGSQVIENPQTTLYRNIIEANSILRLIFVNIKNDGADLQNEAKAVYDSSKGETPYEKIYFAWQDLQTAVDTLLDVSMNRNILSTGGLKQIIEKKEGLIRKHMMGKRVNYAARTVITPDPNINVEEVGIPDIFAKRLSYPVPVTPWNIQELRKMVINGPEVHPGANYIEDNKGHRTLIPANDPAKRQALAKLLLTNPDKGVNIVHRHVLNGDVMLLNRQPTLHRPSIMAHKIRILTGEKTFRLHYSNCKSYNADFDGDEMNAHLPQSEVARSEAYNLVNVANNYLVPKDGTPLGGLIQDQVISGVKLSIRGRFFNREDYQQLVFQGLSHKKGNIKLLPPTILKPTRLWSGKQILSTIIINLIPEGYAPINLNSSAKISNKCWQQNPLHKTTYGGSQLKDNEMSEAEVIIRKGELISGVLDKKQYGATEYGLIHCMYELYGGEVSTNVLTSFTKIFTSFLQREGFTLGVKDILVTAEADKKRRQIIQECRRVGDSVVAEAVNIENENPERELVAEKMAEAYGKDPNFRVILDRKYKSVLDSYTNSINETCLPAGLIQRFPDNNLQLMVLSGAKGSTVNTMQISCLLGQIELEGKRPPLMISGKSLPSFTESETSPKSGGFIDGRFMTGIQPQDFFFHCMAGREGLIDTAVKTSRSGYLQRCLIKHLEGLSVNYDMTVRDSDNSVVQFMYGEDGMDILKSRFFNKESLEFLDQNSESILQEEELEQIKNDNSTNEIRKYQKKLKAWRKKYGDPRAKERMSSFQKFSAELREEIEIEKANKLNSKTGRLKKDEKIIKLWKKADEEKRSKYISKYGKCPDPINSKYQPDNHYGSVSEYMEQLIQSYAEKHPERKEEITDILHIKSIKSMASPGDPVGLLAAQSIGEPSTQMTLNTFHFAGRGEMNVTLGIPRLREILMMASSNIKTPSMDIPFKPNQVKNAEKLRVKLNRVTVADVLETIKVNHKLVIYPERAFQYVLTFNFLPKEAYEDDFCVKPKQIIRYMSDTFFKNMFRTIGKSLNSKNTIVDIGDKDKDKEAAQKDNDLDKEEPEFPTEKKSKKSHNADDSSEEENEADDDDATAIKFKSKKMDDQEYEEPSDDEKIDEKDDDEDDDMDDKKDKDDNDKDDDDLGKNIKNSMVSNYIYDREKYLWCTLTFNLPMKYKSPPDMTNILKQVATKSVIHEVSKINRAITYKNRDDLLLKTDGINIVEMFKYHKMLDINRLYSNDIHAIARTYGIEAATRVIVQEVQNVFKVYGIAVDPRHLSLIADYMTFDGTFKPLSRTGIEYSASPFQQMSFESSMKFLTSATVAGKEDELNSPSSRLMVGLPVKNGTGCFGLMTKIA